MKGRVLIAAGSDSGGGAGVQADIKTVTALGGYAACALTALTAQNTLGVQAIEPVRPDFVAAQMRSVLDDIGADVIKTGMLYSGPVIEAVAGVLAGVDPQIPLVLDPVMVAKGGAALIDDEAVGLVVEALFPRAALVTPNLPEAERLTGIPVHDLSSMRAAASALLAMGPGAVLLKGGHLAGSRLMDLLMDGDGERVFESDRIESVHTHGTGCTLASAIACGLAQRLGLKAAVVRARAYLREAILRAPGLGKGHGPIDHGHTCSRA